MIFADRLIDIFVQKSPTPLIILNGEDEMKKSILAAFVFMFFSNVIAYADLIDFESGFYDMEPVSSVITSTNEVTFWVDGGGPAYIAKVGAPTTAFAVNDTPNLDVAGMYFLTDEVAPPETPMVYSDYYMGFANPVLNLSLHLYDYRDGTVKPGDTATLSVYSDMGMSNLVGYDTFTVPVSPPDGIVAFYLSQLHRR